MRQRKYDLIIKNARILDGTGKPELHGDIAVSNGRIDAIGNLSNGAAKEIDAQGAIACPGFIDVHTHAENILTLPQAENFLRMGVTTLVTGNCGSSAQSIDQFLKEAVAKGAGVNMATLIGHNTVRSRAMGGSHNRPPTTAEMEQMKRLVREGLSQGAFGLSTGLIYVPGTYSNTEEVVQLASACTEFKALYVSHMRNEGAGIHGALDELFEVARHNKIGAQISHIKLSGPSMWGKAKEILDKIDKAREEGLRIYQDQYLYTASSTGISTLIPSEFREGGREQFRQRINDPEIRRQIGEQMKKNLERRGAADYSYAVIASYARDRRLVGKNLPEAAKIAKGGDTLDHQIELVIEIEASGGASGVFHGMSEPDVRTFMSHPRTMIASDSGVRRMSEGVPHPRGYGNNARALHKYVREEKRLELSEAVRKMTSLPAEAFGIPQRGRILEGYWADIAIFHPDRVVERTTYDRPHQFSEGFLAVLVNGKEAVVKDRCLNARAGMAVRRQAL